MPEQVRRVVCQLPGRRSPLAMRLWRACRARGVAPELDSAAVAAKVVDFYQRLPAAVAAQRRAPRSAPPAHGGDTTSAAGGGGAVAHGDDDPGEEVEWRDEAPLTLSRPLELLAGIGRGRGHAGGAGRAAVVPGGSAAQGAQS